MLVELHLCGPAGDVRRQQLARLLNELKQDNSYLINAMLNAGQHVPDTVIELGLEYDPAEGPEKESKRQPLYGMRDMVQLGTFRCGDAAAYEAAVLETKYGVPALCVVVPQGDRQYHGIVVVAEGPIDPTENWLRHWESQTNKGRRPIRNAAAGREPVEQNQMCMIEDGKVQCTGLPDTSGCCVGADGRWVCPSDHPLHGVHADVRKFRRRGSARWAVVGDDGIVVPVCPSEGAR